MKCETKKLEKSQVELRITVAPADYRKELESAAVRLSERAAMKGFRPGKAPYDMVKQQMGELKIIEEAMQDIVEHNFFQAAKEEKLETIGMPKITIEKVAPGNDFVFKAVVALLPKVKLPDLTGIKIKRDAKEIGDKEIGEVLNNLKKMQPKEIIKNGVATAADKVVIDMEMFSEKVPLEGGQSKNHQVYLSEPHYIQGFAEQLVGLKKGETKEFTLKFPEEHYQKHLAGKNVDFKVKVHDVYELQYPELNEEFAKSLGQENMDKLKELLKHNLTEEARQKSEQKAEVEMFDKIVDASQFDEIPDVLIDSEKHKMFHELKHSLEHQGIEMEKYLQDLKKTEEEIFKDFTENAIKRVKAALISRQVALENKIEVAKADVDKEVELIKQTYKDEPATLENLKKPEVLNMIASTIQNRKVIIFLKEKVVVD